MAESATLLEAAGRAASVAAQSARRVATGPSSDQVRAKADQVFRRREFKEGPSLLQRFLDWLFRHKAGSTVLRPGAPPPTSTGLGSFVLYLLIAVLVGVVAWVAWRVIANRPARVKKAKKPSADIEVDQVLSTSQWGRAAARAEAAGDWKEAIRCRYREMVGALVDRGALPPVPGRTTGELRSDLAETAPAATSDFDRASLLFELPWYADLPTGPDENAELRRLAEAVLAATPRVASVDAAPESIVVVDADDPAQRDGAAVVGIGADR